MTALVDELGVVLAAQARELRGLVHLLREEKRALLRADTAAVTALGERKAELVRRLAEFERRRRPILSELSAFLGVGSRTLTLSELSRRLPRPTPALVTARDELKTLLDDALAQTVRNEFLVERTLGWLRGLLGQIASSLAPGPTYAGSGRSVQLMPALQLLDRRA